MAKGQLSLSVVEAGVGVLFVLSVTAGFALGLPAPATAETQLDAYAADTITVLSTEPPRHRAATRLSEVVNSSESFERERDALDRRVERILPDNLMYRLETPHGTVGFRRPSSGVAGRASVATASGEVTVWVWYA